MSSLGNGTVRSAILGLSFSIVATVSFQSMAQDTLVIAGFGGSTEKLLRERVIPGFEKANSVQVQYTAGQSTDTLAKLIAQKSNQQIDVAFIDDGPMAQAVNQGLCTKIEGVDPNDFQPIAVFPGIRAIGYGIVAVGFTYNKKVFAERGWAAPTSWKDLKDPKFKGKLVMAPMSSSYGVLATVLLARIHGGGENNIEPGFATMKTEIGPNVLAYEPSTAKVAEMFQTGEALIGVWGSHRTQALANSGAPVDFAYPTEGAPAVMVTICPTTKEKPSPKAQAFIQLMLSPAVQKLLAENEGIAPARKGVEVADKAGMMPIGPRTEKLVLPDWIAINAKREEWTKRWTREIER